MPTLPAQVCVVVIVAAVVVIMIARSHIINVCVYVYTFLVSFPVWSSRLLRSIGRQTIWIYALELTMNKMLGKKIRSNVYKLKTHHSACIQIPNARRREVYTYLLFYLDYEDFRILITSIYYLAFCPSCEHILSSLLPYLIYTCIAMFWTPVRSSSFHSIFLSLRPYQSKTKYIGIIFHYNSDDFQLYWLPGIAFHTVVLI